MFILPIHFRSKEIHLHHRKKIMCRQTGRTHRPLYQLPITFRVKNTGGSPSGDFQAVPTFRTQVSTANWNLINIFVRTAARGSRPVTTCVDTCRFIRVLRTGRVGSVVARTSTSRSYSITWSIRTTSISFKNPSHLKDVFCNTGDYTAHVQNA